MATDEHLEIIREGAEAWNRWRAENPDIRPDLSHADLADFKLGGADLNAIDATGVFFNGASLHDSKFEGAVLNQARLVQADLCGADLSGANLAEANLYGAWLRGAQLVRTDLRDADLTHTDLNSADLTDADLRGASLVEAILVSTVLRGAQLSGARIYGISAWNLDLGGTVQEDLIITANAEPEITVDNLEVAQFVYLMLNNEKIRSVLTTIGEKGVLILGRFTLERKRVLDALREKLRSLNFVPMMFDFEKADDRSFTETIKILVGLSRFVIADVTNPKSAPLELQATVPDYKVPFVPILQQGEEPFSMLGDLQQYDWVTAVKEYRSTDQLLEKLESKIIEPALKLHASLRVKKAKGILREPLGD